MSSRTKIILLDIIIAIAIFIPTYIAIANYASLGSWQNTLTGEDTVITVQNEEGVTVFDGTAGQKSNSDLAQALAALLANGESLRTAPSVSSDLHYTVTAKNGNRKCDYYCYYISENSESYLFDVEANVCYAIASADMLPFLQSVFYGETAQTLSTPMLITAGNEVAPSYISWQHKNNQGNYNPVMTLNTVSEEMIYPVNKNISLQLEPTPDIATVRVYDGSIELYNGSWERFAGFSYTDSVTLTVAIQAKWEQRDDRDYYGEASYQFYVNYSANPTFTISATAATSKHGKAEHCRH